MNFFLSTISFIFLSLIIKGQLLSENKLDNKILYISVNGLVCDFCARSIEKLFSRKESVADINVNLEKMLITINLKKGKKLNDKIIKEVIEDSGYNIKEIRRE